MYTVQEARSLSARVATEKDSPLKKDDKSTKFCHFYNNEEFCKHGKDCKYQHEKSLVCRDCYIDAGEGCTKQLCQFRHCDEDCGPVNIGDQNVQEAKYIECKICEEWVVGKCVRRSCQRRLRGDHLLQIVDTQDSNI